MRKNFYISRQFLTDLGLTSITFDDYGPSNLYRNTKKGPTIVRRHIVTTKHKYGKDLAYMYFSLMFSGKVYNIPAADIAFLLYHPEYDAIPYGYEVDHIDDNPFNNNVDNLQLLTHLENIRKRPVACNHHRYIKKCNQSTTE